MVTIEYLLPVGYKTATQLLIDLLGDFGFKAETGCKLDVLPSFRYEFYTNHIWHDGIIFGLGKWKNYDKQEKKWYSLDMLRIKVNPNKHVGTALFDSVLKYISDNCKDGCLVRYDYAVDIPVDISDVIVVGSRKEKGLYKGTRYYGQRHKHGYLKVYDKAREQKLDCSLTRLEYTYNPRDIPSWDNIVIRAPTSDGNGREALPNASRLYVDMLLEIRALGGEIEPYVERMNYRTWKKIEPYLMQGNRLNLNQTILDDLINKINDMFIISDTDNGVNTDDDFMICDTDLPLDWRE